MLHYKWKALGIDDQSFSRFVGDSIVQPTSLFHEIILLIAKRIQLHKSININGRDLPKW